MSTFEVRQVPRQHTVVVPVSTDPARIPQAMGEALRRAFEAVESSGLAPAGPPFSRYFSFGPDRLEFEAGVPVAAPFVGGSDDARAGELGGCEAAVAMHVGPYETLDQTYTALTRWLEGEGRAASGPMWEHYLTDPDTAPDPATWRTEVFVPVG